MASPRDQAGRINRKDGRAFISSALDQPLAFMHPGPINRNVEIADEVADDPERSMILLQVEAGVATRMACLELVTAV